MLNRLKNILFNKPISNENLILLSEDLNGFERERAIKQMREKRDIAFLDALLIRANDWVPQVRNLAQEVIRELMVEPNKKAFTENIEAIWQLKKKGRCDHSQLVKDISNFVLQNVSQDELISKVKSGHRTLARVAYELLSHSLPAKDLVQLALASKDILIIRNLGLYLNQLEGYEFETVFKSTIDSPNAYLRCIVLQIGIKKIPDQVKTCCEDILIDNSADIRLVSINFFKIHNFEIRKFYLDQLQKPSKTKIKANTILGIGQAGYADCADVIRPYLSNSFATIREAAFRALYAFNPKDSDVRKSVLDKSPKVSKTALFYIRKNEIKVSFEELTQWFEVAPVHTIKGLLRLARQSGKWSELILILKSFRRDPEVYSLALNDWLRVFNLHQQLPTSEETTTLQGLRQVILEDLNKDTLELLRFTLKPFGILV